MTRRHECCLSVSPSVVLDGKPSAENRQLRNPTQEDTCALAELMLSAYRGSVDDAGETLGQATDEIERYFASPRRTEGSVAGQSALFVD